MPYKLGTGLFFIHGTILAVCFVVFGIEKAPYMIACAGVSFFITRFIYAFYTLLPLNVDNYFNYRKAIAKRKKMGFED